MKKLNLTIPSLILLSLLGQAPAYAEIDCNIYFRKIDSQELYSPSSYLENIENLKALRKNDPTSKSLHKEMQDLYTQADDKYAEVSEALKKDLKRNSDVFKSILKQNPEDEEIRTFDYLFVGAGIHTGIAKASMATSMGTEFSNLKILTVEATNDISVFGRLGKSFQGNTLEHPQLGLPEGSKLTRDELLEQSRNFQPGAGVQVADVAKQQVPVADQFQVPAVTNHWLYGDDFLFETPVDKVKKIKNKYGETLYEIETKTGEKFYSRNIVMGTGLGEAKLPSKDPASVKFINEQMTAKNPKVFFVEDLLQRINDKQKIGENFMKPFAGKKVVVVGGGHGGAIGIEAIEGLGPKSLYQSTGGVDESLLPSSYTWVNLKANNGEEFKKVIGGGNRYYDLAPLLDNGKIKSNQYYIHEILPEGSGVKVSYLDKETGLPVRDSSGNIMYEEADYIIYATGYNSPNNKILDSFASEDGIRFDPVEETITPMDKRLYTETPVTVANQVYSKSGNPENIYIIGPGAGQIGHAKDPGGPSSVTMNVFAARSEALGKRLAKIKEKK